MPYKVCAVFLLICLLHSFSGLVVYAEDMKKHTGPKAITNWDQHRLGPKDRIDVYWVGHSLMDSQRLIDGKKSNTFNVDGRPC